MPTLGPTCSSHEQDKLDIVMWLPRRRTRRCSAEGTEILTDLVLGRRPSCTSITQRPDLYTFRSHALCSVLGEERVPEMGLTFPTAPRGHREGIQECRNRCAIWNHPSTRTASEPCP